MLGAERWVWAEIHAHNGDPFKGRKMAGGGTYSRQRLTIEAVPVVRENRAGDKQESRALRVKINALDKGINDKYERDLTLEIGEELLRELFSEAIKMGLMSPEIFQSVDGKIVSIPIKQD